MAQTFSQEHLQELMVFPFRNLRWKSQFAIGGLLTLANFVVPILPMLLVYGYSLQIVRGIVQERQLPSMPLWDDWGRLLTDGLRALVVRIVFIAPAVLLILVGYALSMALSIGPALLLAADSGGDATAALVSMLGTFASMVVWGPAMLLMVAGQAALMPALGHMTARNELVAAFRVREWWPIFRANLGGYVLGFALYWGLGMMLGMVASIFYFTIVLCCLLPFVTALTGFYTTLIGSALTAQAYLSGVDRLAQQYPSTPIAVEVTEDEELR